MTTTTSPETLTYRAAYTELSRSLTSSRLETLVKFVMRSALEGCVHSWIASEGSRLYGVRPELVRGLLAV